MNFNREHGVSVYPAISGSQNEVLDCLTARKQQKLELRLVLDCSH